MRENRIVVTYIGPERRLSVGGVWLQPDETYELPSTTVDRYAGLLRVENSAPSRPGQPAASILDRVSPKTMSEVVAEPEPQPVLSLLDRTPPPAPPAEPSAADPASAPSILDREPPSQPRRASAPPEKTAKTRAPKTTESKRAAKRSSGRRTKR